jgi:hypothetical protein
MQNMGKKIPEFQSEEEEFEFWSKADSTEYLDWSEAKRAKLPNLKPTLRTISVRLQWPWWRIRRFWRISAMFLISR